MRFQIIVDILDTISPLITMAFGIFGATRDTKPRDGKLTKDGKIALWGIILSSCFTLLIKSGNLYNKNIEQEHQNKLQKIAEEKKRSEDSSNLVFQQKVATSFNNSIRSLSNIDSAAKHNIQITEQVSSASVKNLLLTNNLNNSTKRNFILAEQINTQTSGILFNTEKVLNPLFPLNIIVTFRIDAKYLNGFWDYMSKCKDYKKESPDVFDNLLTSERYSQYKKENPEDIQRFNKLFDVSLHTDFTKKNDKNDEMTLSYFSSDTLIDFKKLQIYLNFYDQTFTVIMKIRFQKPSVVETNNWLGDKDLQNCLYEVGIWGKSNIQLNSMFIDHDASGIYLYGACFMELDVNDVPWIYEYKGEIKLQKKGEDLSWCIMQSWVQRLFEEK